MTSLLHSPCSGRTISTYHMRTFRVEGSDRHQRLFSFWYEVCPFPLLEPLLEASHPCFDSLIRIPHVVSPFETHLLVYTCSIRLDVTSGGGTGGSWWTVLTRGYCGCERAVGVQGYGTKEENPQTSQKAKPSIINSTQKSSNVWLLDMS